MLEEQTMAETEKIAQMAEILSDELFTEFFWQKIGTTNHNWSCEDQEKHGNKTHPSDVVFYYDEPYSQSRTYINCDLKSYAKGTIKANTIKEAIESLAKQVACAEKSSEWRELYVHDHVTPEICGLLFVYNHDGEYDKDFSNLLSSVKTDQLDIPKGSKIVVLGPKDIFWLDNIRYDLCLMRGKSGADKLPNQELCRFFYPQLIRKTNVQIEKAKASTLEMLVGPWIILEYKKEQNRKGFIIYYKRKGETTEEFIYLIDYLRHYQVLSEDTDIQIRTLDSAPTAPAIFKKAVDRYIEEMTESNQDSDFSILVRNIKFSKMPQVKSTFSEIEIGMDL